MKPYYLLFILALFPLYFIILVIYGLICSFIEYVIDKKIIIENKYFNFKIILYVSDKNELEEIKNLIPLDNNVNIVFNNKMNEFENKIYNLKKLNKIARPIMILIDNKKLEVIKLYKIIKIKKNRLKKIRKIKTRMNNILK
jgi:hypothetical protein